ncbi:MAG TPA: c-type cytochrome [Burkholderiales bacterium]|jgi:cytochrome c553|nr:c-type cytochrome [Burkholderiales bacterium]
MRIASATLAAVWLAAAASAAHAQAIDKAKARSIVDRLCVACHGVDGNSPQPAHPKIAGLQPEYLLKQLRDYRKGLRKSEIMEPMVKELTEDDMASLAAYYAEQQPKPGEARDGKLAEAGRKLYNDGIPDVGLPSCSGCHYPDGIGTARFPRVAGQHAEYTYQQLKDFASGKRENDRGLAMQSVANRMNDQQMRAVAEYVAGMK